MKKSFTFVTLVSAVLVSFFFPVCAHGLESVNGYFIRDQRGAINFFSYEYKRKYSLQAGSQTVADQLLKLESFDALRGTASLKSNDMVLESIDFVGLRRLLGDWQGQSMVIQFKTFIDVSLYSYKDTSAAARGNYKYALTPGIGDQWKVFFTDENQVALASLTLSGPNYAVLTFYNSQTGEIARTLQMKKINSK